MYRSSDLIECIKLATSEHRSIIPAGHAEASPHWRGRSKWHLLRTTARAPAATATSRGAARRHLHTKGDQGGSYINRPYGGVSCVSFLVTLESCLEHSCVAFSEPFLAQQHDLIYACISCRYNPRFEYVNCTLSACDHLILLLFILNHKQQLLGGMGFLLARSQ